MDKQADLRKWFKEKWVDISRKKKGGGHPECGRDDADSGGGYPKCRPQRAAARMSKKQKTYAVRSKRSKPQGVDGKPTMVATFKKKAMSKSKLQRLTENMTGRQHAALGGALGGIVGPKSAGIGGALMGDNGRGIGTALGGYGGAYGGGILGGTPGRIVGGALGAAFGHGESEKKKKKNNKEGMKKKAMFNPEINNILENLEKKASMRGLGVAAKRMMGPSGRKMMRTGMANPVRTAAGIGAAAGALKGAVKPGTNPDGTQKSRLAAIAKNTAGGAALGAGAAYGASKLK
jgi:hypothetical protein